MSVFLALPKIGNVTAVNTNEFVIAASFVINVVLKLLLSRVRRERMGHIELGLSGSSRLVFQRRSLQTLSSFRHLTSEILSSVIYFSQYVVLKSIKNKQVEVLEKVDKQSYKYN